MRHCLIVFVIWALSLSQALVGQTDHDPFLGNIDLRWFLSRSMERGLCTGLGADAIWNHVQQFGYPRSPEEAWTIQGLSVQEKSWLLHEPKWHELAKLSGGESARTALRVSYHAVHRFGANALTTRTIRTKASTWRGSFRWGPTIEIGGAVHRRVRGWTLVVGDHTVGWGSGLTIPRSDPFGAALFLGQSMIGSPYAPRPAYHSRFQGGMRGIAVEKGGDFWNCGLTAGLGHVGASVSREHPRGHVGTTMFYAQNEWHFGLDALSGFGALDSQISIALENRKFTINQAIRWALTNQFLVNMEGAWLQRSDESAWKLLGQATWLSNNKGGHCQFRVRRNEGGEWDCRGKGDVGRFSDLSWNFLGSTDESIAGIEWNKAGMKLCYWVGRNLNERWSHAKHIEWEWDFPSKKVCGVFLQESNASWRGTYVALPSAEGKAWSHTPNHGKKMGIWIHGAKRDEHILQGHWSRSWLFIWSPSQLETFRVAWQWKWEA